MYTAGFLVVASLLATSANAHPEFNERRDCSHNDCLRAVIASAVPGGNARGSADCSSYFRKTVTPSAATATITLTSTLTGDPVYSTVTNLSVVPVTVTTSVCTAAVVTVVPRADKQEVTADEINAPPVRHEAHQARHAHACPAKPPASSSTSTSSTTAAATTTTATKATTTKATTTKATTTATPISGIPTYASACGGVSAYSSACSCNGIPESTVTLSQVTNTVTAWASQTVIPTSATTVDIVSSSTTTVTIVAHPTSLGPSFYVKDLANGRSLAAGNGLQLVDVSGGTQAPLAINGCGRVTSATSLNYSLVSAGTGSGDGISFVANPSSGFIHCTVQNPSVPSGSFTCQSENGVDTVLNLCPGNDNVQLSSVPMAGCLQPAFTVVHS